LKTKSKPVDKDNSKSGLILRRAIPSLGLAGIVISAYLTYIHYTKVSPICLGIADCDEVLASPYAQMWGVPLSLLGLLMYVALMLLGFLMLSNKVKRQDLIVMGTYTLAVAGTLFTLYLYYLEIFEIHAFCTWCIASSIVMFITLIISIMILRTSVRTKVDPDTR
jgi:uncharacterized membrane protein